MFERTSDNRTNNFVEGEQYLNYNVNFERYILANLSHDGPPECSYGKTN